MGYLFRHMAVRLWMTVLIGGMVSLWLVPYGTTLFGANQAFIPASFIFILVFFTFGVISNRIVKGMIQRLLDEASLWQRAHRYDDAEEAFEKALGLLDSYLITPAFKKRYGPHVLSCVVKYYLSTNEDDPKAEKLILYYLRHHVEDESVSESWLKFILSKKNIPNTYHSIVDHIGETFPEHLYLQYLSAQFYIKTKRTDFFALKAYQFIISQKKSADYKTLLTPLSQLLMDEKRFDHWTLDIYLDAYALNHEDEALFSAIVFCIYELKHHNQTHPLMHDAILLLKNTRIFNVKEILKKSNYQPFVKKQVKPETQLMEKVESYQNVVKDNVIEKESNAGSQDERPFTFSRNKDFEESEEEIGQVAPVKKRISPKREYPINQWLIYGGIAAFIIFLFFKIPLLISPWPDASIQNASYSTLELKKETKAGGSVHFTLQIAAYPKKSDAEKYVDSLKNKGVDAYLEDAKSATKKWYQVRLSEFPSKEGAKQFGEALKKKGVIKDYYIVKTIP